MCVCDDCVCVCVSVQVGVGEVTVIIFNPPTRDGSDNSEKFCTETQEDTVNLLLTCQHTNTKPCLFSVQMRGLICVNLQQETK